MVNKRKVKMIKKTKRDELKKTKTIKVTGETLLRLNILKATIKCKTIDELLNKLVDNYEK